MSRPLGNRKNTIEGCGGRVLTGVHCHGKVTVSQNNDDIPAPVGGEGSVAVMVPRISGNKELDNNSRKATHRRRKIIGQLVFKNQKMREKEVVYEMWKKERESRKNLVEMSRV